MQTWDKAACRTKLSGRAKRSVILVAKYTFFGFIHEPIVAHNTYRNNELRGKIQASPAYLQLARERLSLDALDAWEGKPVEPTIETYTDLPLFG